MDYCHIAAKRIETFNFEERRRFLRLLVNEVRLQGDTAIIKGVIPVSRTAGNNAQTAIANDRVASTEIYFRNRDAVEASDRVAGTEIYFRNRDAVEASDRVAGTELYFSGLNAVQGISFELAKSLQITRITLRQRLETSILRQLVELHPRASLRELSQYIHSEQGIDVHITYLSRLLKQVDLPDKVRRNFGRSPDDDLVVSNGHPQSKCLARNISGRAKQKCLPRVKELR